jgi:hypothetical protein
VRHRLAQKLLIAKADAEPRLQVLQALALDVAERTQRGCALCFPRAFLFL